MKRIILSVLVMCATASLAISAQNLLTSYVAQNAQEQYDAESARLLAEVNKARQDYYNSNEEDKCERCADLVDKLDAYYNHICH